MNHMKPGIFTENIHSDLIRQFYIRINEVFRLTLGKQVLGLSTTSELEDMMKEEPPYLVQYREELRDCLQRGNCSSISSLLHEELTVTSLSPEGSPTVSHPHHITPDTSQSFIPYCGFATDLKLLGHQTADDKFPVCDKFIPVLLEGQLCYRLDVTPHLSSRPSFGQKEGLLLAVDTNPDRSAASFPSKEVNSEKSRIDTAPPDGGVVTSPRVYIHTLAGYSGYGTGRYVITSIKDVTATDSFMELSQENRVGCQEEDREECIVKAYVNETLSKCQCWPLGWTHLSYNHGQNLSPCSPSGMDCYMENITHKYNCTTSCQGSYADVNYLEGGRIKDSAKFEALSADYQMEKQRFASNLFFNPNGDELGFYVQKRPYSSLQMYLIYFDTSTFDRIHQDTKVTLETMVGVVGGTFGLFTGFSILSGVEIIYYSIKFLFSVTSLQVKLDKKNSKKTWKK